MGNLYEAIRALDVAEPELRAYDDTDIEYINYKGPYAFFNTAEEIRGIGRNLDILRRRDGSIGLFPGRYHLQRLPPPADGSRYGADILTIEDDAAVDHINNVRRILAGYLMHSFRYDQAEAGLLAESITVYNTVLRGRIDYVAGLYTPDVLTKAKAASFGGGDGPRLSLKAFPISGGFSRTVSPLRGRNSQTACFAGGC